MALDGFLELIKDKKAVQGETLDKTFGTKDRKAMSIEGFKLKPASTKSSKKKKKGQHATEEEAHDEHEQQSHGKAAANKKPKFPCTFTISKEVDAATTELFLAYCRHADEAVEEKAKFFDLARVTLRKAQGPTPLEYLVFEFTKVFVTSFEIKSDEKTGAKENISFMFQTCKMVYTPQTMKGVVPKETFWDFGPESEEDEAL